MNQKPSPMTTTGPRAPYHFWLPPEDRQIKVGPEQDGMERTEAGVLQVCELTQVPLGRRVVVGGSGLGGRIGERLQFGCVWHEALKDRTGRGTPAIKGRSRIIEHAPRGASAIGPVR
jgi:hypothetical protein